jgi:hypothetical protein
MGHGSQLFPLGVGATEPVWQPKFEHMVVEAEYIPLR